AEKRQVFHAAPDAAQGGSREAIDQTIYRQGSIAPAAGLRAERVRHEHGGGQGGGAKPRAVRPRRRQGGSSTGRNPYRRGQRRQAIRRAAQGRRRRVHLLQSVDRRSSDLRRAGRRAGDQAHQGRPGRRGGRHGGRLCAGVGADRRRRRRQYRPAQRHDPDGQHLEGPDSASGRSGLDRPERARPRSMAGNRPSRADDAADHQVVLAGAIDRGDRRDHAARAEIRLHAAVRTGVSVAAHQHAQRTCQDASLGAQQVRRADAHPARQGGRREGGAAPDRSEKPLLSIGDEITWCRGEKELLELAELLGARVSGEMANLGYWSKPFPTRHPLFIGTTLRTMRYPGKPDVLLNLGNRWGELASPGTTLISIRLDPNSLARQAPVDLAMVADLRLAMADLTAAIRSMATASRLKDIAEERAARTRAYSAQMAELREAIGRDLANETPISMERLGMELEKNLDRDTCYVADVDSGKTMDPLMSFGGDAKHYFGTGPNVLGWGMAAGFGVKLARPDQPVVSVVGDGSFLFSGPQPLWSMARYKAPVTVIVLNNHSYNNERNRIWNGAGRQFEAARDMTCYNGNPDVDFAKTADAFGVEGEAVKEPAALA